MILKQASKFTTVWKDATRSNGYYFFKNFQLTLRLNAVWGHALSYSDKEKQISKVHLNLLEKLQI